MSNAFEPQKVPPSSIKKWGREALSLTMRGPHLFVIPLLALSFLMSMAKDIPVILSVVLLPVFLGYGTIACECLDKGTGLFTALRRKPKKVWVGLLLVSLVTFLYFILAITIIGAVLPDGHTDSQSPGLPPNMIDSMSILAVWLGLYIAPAYWSFWLVVPLLSNAEISVKVALSQSGMAYSKNRFLIVVNCVFTLSLFLISLVDLLTVAIFPVSAFMTAMMYVSYRHIWLNKLDNEKLASKASVGEPASQSV